MANRRAPSRRRAELSNLEKEIKARWTKSWLDEAAAVFCFAVAVFLLASVLSNQFPAATVAGPEGAIGQRGLVGPVGHVVGTLLFGTMGWCSLVPVLWLIWFSVFLWRYDSSPESARIWLRMETYLGFLGVVVSTCILSAVFLGRHGGGSLGTFFGNPLLHLFDTVGATLIGSALLLLALALTTQSSALDVVGFIGKMLQKVLVLLINVPIVAFNLFLSCLYALAGLWRLFTGMLGVRRGEADALAENPRPKPKLRRNLLESDGAVKTANAPGGPPEQEAYTHVVVSRRTPEKLSKQRSKTAAEAGKTKAQESQGDFSAYRSPSYSLLTPSEISAGGEDDAELLEKSRLIENKLRDFGVLGRVTQVHPGPVITLFEFEPAAGVKVGRVSALADDLAMSLRAISIRIIAPIPKRGTVGIEIPNRHRDLVRLRDVLESDAFANAESVLSVAIGKDTYGEPVVVDIDSMPHLLMAGATGTGKSVCINSVLLSILYRASPADVGFIMIDPKILELSVYEGIPHLRVPVVTHPRQAKAVLQWAVDEMHRRYRLIQKFGMRNIDGYNRIVKGEAEPDAPQIGQNVLTLPEESVVEEGTVEKEEGESSRKSVTPEKLQPLPRIMIVIDEVADLMLSVGRDIEELITRLAQKSRAAGIHLLIATQRPSVDVVTGLIKANFPTRISFRVATRIDSRTILDSMGAEKLLGRGDMLLMQPGAEALRRVHGAFVSDNEVKRVISAVKEKCTPCYDEQIMRICEKALEEDEGGGATSGEGVTEGEYDPMYDKAVELVVEKGHASTSMIQRVFRLGYNRAARIIEQMEKDGIVGPMDGAKPREVLMARDMSETEI
jgi:DNA segregation ATPase FtsK/SpoIIIE, S-DNA-T family